jgi:NAD(P)-dependent dehydrogenase (short-subunit alcohol dehydrogenase family)
MASLFSLDGKVAVVTGGSRGIGYMIADGLIDAGCRVIISARKVEPLNAAAEALSAKGECVAVPADLSTPDGCTQLAAAVADQSDSLPILVNNAGASWGAAVDDFPVSGWDKVMDTNVRSAFLLTQALLPQLRAAASETDPARVINIGSVDGLRVPAIESYSYSASKAAVHMLTRHLAKRLAPEHITVNAIAPGPFDSKMMAFLLDDPQGRAAVAAEVPLGRIGHPDDMAGAAIFLASRAGSYLTGAVVPVSGGVACAD